MSKKKSKQLSVRLLIMGGVILSLGFLLGLCVSFFHVRIANSPTAQVANQWQQYDIDVSEANGSFQSSFKYPASSRVFRTDAYPSEKQELTVSVGQNNNDSFTIDVYKADLPATLKEWAGGYNKTQTIMINKTAWTYFSSKDCSNPQSCASDDIWYISGAANHQVILHFGGKEVTQLQKDILSTFTFKEINLL